MPVVMLDQLTAIAGSHAAIAALYERERTGEGQDVHASLYGSATWRLHTQLVSTSVLGSADIAWNRRAKSPLRTTFRCGDGKWLMGTHAGSAHWAAFCHVLAQDEFAGSPPDVDNPAALEAMFDILDPILLQRSAEEWLAIMRPAGLMFSPIQTFAEVLTDAQALANGFVADVAHPRLGAVRLPGYPARFRRSGTGFRKPAPGLGEHTHDVLGNLGYTTEGIEMLRESQVI